MLTVNVMQTGGSTKRVSVPEGSTIQDVLDKAGVGDLETISYNGIRTSEFDQEVEDNATIFITRSHKAG